MLYAALISAFQMLTRIPTPSLPAAPDRRMLAWSGVFYPLVGWFLGLLGWAVFSAAAGWWGGSIAAVLVLILWALLTGALHEDGLSDVSDAFGSQRTHEGLLRVMKDSRVGAFGALALVLFSLLRWQGLAALPEGTLQGAVVASQTIPRAGIVLLALAAGPATSGTGGSFSESLRPGQIMACFALAGGLLWPWYSPRLGLAAAAALIAVVLCILYFRSRLGGVTGDCLGAAALLQEIAVLLVFAAEGVAL